MKNFIKSRYWGFGIAFRKELLELALPFPVQNEMGHDMILGFIADINNKIYFEKHRILYIEDILTQLQI